MNKRALFAFLLLCVIASSCFKRHPLNENALLQQRACIESLDIKDYPRALVHCELCLEYDNSMPECLNGIGLIALVATDEEKAISYFSRALRQDNNFSEARNNLGAIYFGRGDFSKALRYFDKALEIDPSNSDARYNSALSHFRLAERARARDDKKDSLEHLLTAYNQIQKLIAVEPHYDHAFRDLGLIELNRYDLSEFSDRADLYLLSAEKAFNQCIAINPENDGCHEGMGQVKIEQANFDQAFAHYFMCLSFDSSNAACRKGIVFAYEKSARLEGGYKHFSQNIAKNPQNAEAHEAFCTALFERGFNNEARQECEVALKLKPSLCSAHFRLAKHFASILDPVGSVHHCQEYLKCETNASNNDQFKLCQDIIVQVKR